MATLQYLYRVRLFQTVCDDVIGFFQTVTEQQCKILEEEQCENVEEVQCRYKISLPVLLTLKNIRNLCK